MYRNVNVGNNICILIIMQGGVLYLNIKNAMGNLKIKVVVMVSVVMWILVFSQLAIDIMCEKKISIKEAFAIGDDIRVEKCTHEVVSKIYDEDISVIVDEIMKANACNDYAVSEKSGIVNVKGKIEEYIIEMTLTQIYYDDAIYLHYFIYNNEKYEDYMPDECYIKSENTMLKIKKMGADSIRYTRIDGVLEGEMSENICRSYTEKILERIGAKKVSEHFDKDYTAYGYSDKLENAVESDRKKINVNIRFTYNEINKNTEIAVATPLIMD